MSEPWPRSSLFGQVVSNKWKGPETMGTTVFSRAWLFVLFVLLVSTAFFFPLRTLLKFSLEHEHYSHIALVPVVSLFLLYLRRREIFAGSQPNATASIPLFLAGSLVFAAGRLAPELSQNDSLSLTIAAYVLYLLALFLLCFGVRAFREGSFPLLFLFLMAPIPDLVLQGTISWLVAGSTEVTDLFFKLTGVPVYRDGAVFALPGLTIEVAKECSGIRSSLALFITALLAGHFFLRSNLRRVFLIVAAIPIVIVKNGVRIATLTLLAIYVNPGFLAGNLHRNGGVVFFALGLVLLWSILRILEKTERKAEEHVPAKSTV